MTEKFAHAVSKTCVCVCVGAASLFAAAARADTGVSPPCGELAGPSAAAGATNSGFYVRDGEPVVFISGGEATPGRLLVFRDGPLFRAYWQPQGSEEKYALSTAGTNSVRLVSTPPQGIPARDGRPGVLSQPLLVLSCPKL